MFVTGAIHCVPYIYLYAYLLSLNNLQIVTCGSVPLESTFTRVPRCVYTSTSLYEYRGWNSKPANPQHRLFTWGLRATEVSDCFSVYFTSLDLIKPINSEVKCLLIYHYLHIDYLADSGA